jgi:hypothetical protein
LVSSSIVNKASIAGCGISVLSKIAMIAATPDRYQHQAVPEHPISIYIHIDSLCIKIQCPNFLMYHIQMSLKHNCFSVFHPAVAGLRIITLRISSSKFLIKAFKSFHKRITRSSFRRSRYHFKSTNLFFWFQISYFLTHLLIFEVL